MFSAPLWLFGLFALAIPLVLHLWSRRPRQVIRVGTLRHVDLTADARSWSARLVDPLLLAVRMALLAAIVFALAGLRLPTRSASGSGGTIVLVDAELLESDGFPFLDSLKREHAWVRLLQPGVPKLQLGAPAAEARIGPTDIWAALVDADRITGPNGTIHVVARPRFATIHGSRPRVRATIEWHAPPRAQQQSWKAPAWWKEDSTPWRVFIEGEDSVAERRMTVALRAIGDALERTVTVAAVPDSADLVVTSTGLRDSLLALSHPLVLLSPATVASDGLADSIWAQWPIHSRSDKDDPRELSIAQALPSRPMDAPAPLGNPDSTRRGLILLALLLFTIERWLATRPGRSEV